MRVGRIHLDFWLAKKCTPGWIGNLLAADRHRPAVELIDRCVNHNGGVKTAVDSAGSLLQILRGVRGQGGNVLAFLESVRDSPGCLYRPGRRSGYAKKWAERLKRCTRAIT